MEPPENLPTTVYLAGCNDRWTGPVHRSARAFFSSAAAALRHGTFGSWNAEKHLWEPNKPTHVLKGAITWEVEEL